MRSILALAAILAGATLFGVATLATASAARGEGGPTTAVSPASHEDDDDEDGDGVQGPPPDRGPPDGVGRGRARGRTGQHGLHGPPQLPAHASPRAHAAVQLAFDRQQAIRERIEQIHALPGGPGKGQAVSELMRHFGQL